MSGRFWEDEFGGTSLNRPDMSYRSKFLGVLGITRSATLGGILLAGGFLASHGQSVESLSIGELDERLDQSSESVVRVYNFWATWCAPCVRELPYFEEVNGFDDVRVFFVSVDGIKDLKKVSNMAEKKNLKSPVWHLAGDGNEYIGRVSETWSGTIPATLFIGKDGKRVFHEGEFTRDELVDFLQKFRT